MRRSIGFFLACLLATTSSACGDDDAPPMPMPDAGPGEPQPLPTDHCDYAPLPPTAHSGGTVSAGAIQVGLAELPLGLPIGGALGGNTSRAAVIPDGAQGLVDGREVPLCGSFTPSVGVETIPMVKAVAITAGEETVVILRTDTIFGDDTITHAVTERLGPELAGKVLWTSSHSHTAPAQYSADQKFQVGAGRVREEIRQRLIDVLVEAAEAALDARVPARIGIATEENFDPEDHVSYDRRDLNDFMYEGRPRKDIRVALIRIDAMDGTPMAILPIFGVHSAILDDDVSVFSTDASGAFERHLEEQFDHPVTAIHIQGAAGDVLGASDVHLQHADDELRWDFARNEECGRWALPQLMAIWERAGENMVSEIEMEMVTRSVPMGPDWRTFTTREGALEYAPFDGQREADGRIFAEDGTTVLSPIDEFNAPGGAGLCGEEEPLLPSAQMPGVEGLVPYRSCQQIPRVTQTLGILLDFEFGEMPICSSTRTTVAALRLGDYLFGVAPGEPLVPWRDYVARNSPVPEENTFVIGYALGHNAYILTPEDWLQGGFEPTINSWGPLEGQYLAERILEVMQLATTPEREDAAAGGTDRVVPGSYEDPRVPPPDAAPMAGTVPTTVPSEVYFRDRFQVAQAQPEASIERVNGVARFVWIGEDPLAGTPRVTLEREVDGAFVPVRRRSGRPVQDLDLLMIWTPLPLEYTRGMPRTHYWTLEWQAVGWEIGTPLDERFGVPLGRYRFHVEGTGYTVDSQPFEVVPGTMQVSASRDGEAIVIDARMQPVDGWRLLRMEGLSNVDVPIESGPLSVTLEYASGAPETIAAPLTGPGAARVTPTGTGTITRIVVRDRYGNVGEDTL